MTSPGGQIHVTHYGHRPPGEASPVFSLTPEDAPWFEHFATEAERWWDSGTPWPLSSSEQIARATRPVFSEKFGPEFTVAVAGANELFVTGKARNAFVLTHYNLLERKLQAGSSMRFLLIDPDSPAIEVAADRYVERAAASARERVVHTLRLLTKLRASTQGALSVRLTDHPSPWASWPRTGKRLRSSRSTTRTRAHGDPKFVLQPGNTFGYDLLLTEAEALWENGKPHDLA